MKYTSPKFESSQSVFLNSLDQRQLSEVYIIRFLKVCCLLWYKIYGDASCK